MVFKKVRLRSLHSSGAGSLASRWFTTWRWSRNNVKSWIFGEWSSQIQWRESLQLDIQTLLLGIYTPYYWVYKPDYIPYEMETQWEFRYPSTTCRQTNGHPVSDLRRSGRQLQSSSGFFQITGGWWTAHIPRKFSDTNFEGAFLGRVFSSKNIAVVGMLRSE